LVPNFDPFEDCSTHILVRVKAPIVPRVRGNEGVDKQRTDSFNTVD
jgi:hypothetical protein